MFATILALAACGGTADASNLAPQGTTAAPQLTGLVTQWGVISEPHLPTAACVTLNASLSPANGSIDAVDRDPTHSQPDTARIQKAINDCPSGTAVKLTAGHTGATGFLSGPLVLKSGVSLWIDYGVTLFASRNPADYDNGRGTCGTATITEENACSPFILADKTEGSGIIGEGTIDGRGGSVLTNGPNAGIRSWWDVAYQNKTQNLHQQNPLLIHVHNGSGFVMYRVAIVNAPNTHIVTTGVYGVTIWGIKILSPTLEYSAPGYACSPNSTPDKKTPATCFTPETAKNTDGFDPGQSSNVLLAYSYISDGDDNVAVKSHGRKRSNNIAFMHNHFYYGHGMSIGSETDSSLSSMVVDDLSIDGFDSSAGVGLRIKSDSSRGGTVSNVIYRNVCMRSVRQPLVFDSYYRNPRSGTKYPIFTNITISGLHSLGSRKYGGGQLTFAGFDAEGIMNPLSITLNNVVFDGPQPTFASGHNGGPSIIPAATHFILGPGAVSFASSIEQSPDNDVSVTGAPGRSEPVDCDNAFVPLHTVLSVSPI
ncbi:glycoside hydrolase family 28 protein [Burkholderia sp. Bp9140]|nr:glycoside hydrolase family 28 protein [Burkholderia sp. Bp9140]